MLRRAAPAQASEAEKTEQAQPAPVALVSAAIGAVWPPLALSEPPARSLGALFASDADCVLCVSAFLLCVMTGPLMATPNAKSAMPIRYVRFITDPCVR